MKYLSQTPIQNKRVLLRVDYNVSLTPAHTISDDERIKQSLPTIKELLKGNNLLVIVTHLGRPEGIDKKFSLTPVKEKLQEYMPNCTVTLVEDFTKDTEPFKKQTANQILLLENIRFFKEEKQNSPAFSQQLANLADVYVNDAFSVDHRAAASTVGVTEHLPSFAGLALEEEMTYLTKILKTPQTPFVAITGGGKISTKLTLLENLLNKVDTLIIGGGIANTLIKAQGHEIGQSICEDDLLPQARELISRYKTQLLLPTDVTVLTPDNTPQIRQIKAIEPTDSIRDIGPQTIETFSKMITTAKTILWNGPVGNFENTPFEKGTDAIYKAVTDNTSALSIVGGGDTIAALSKHPDFHQKISHISTGGGAMLSFLQDGSLPGIDALEKNTMTVNE